MILVMLSFACASNVSRNMLIYFSDECSVYCRHFILQLIVLLLLPVVFPCICMFLLCSHLFWLLCCIFEIIFSCTQFTTVILFKKKSAWLVHSLHLKIIFTLYLCYISMQIHNISSLTDNHTFLWTHFSCPASKSPTYFSLQSLGGVFAHHTSELQVSHRESFLCNFSWLIFSHTNSKKSGVVIFCILKDVFQESGNNHPLVKLIFH